MVDAPTDAPAPESRACAPSGSPCVRVSGEQLRFHDGVVWTIPPGADRVAVSDDRWVAFVAPRRGWPAVHLLDPEGRLRPLTNVDLVRTPGRPPDGFVPPPVREGDLRIEADALSWTLPDGSDVRVDVAALAERSQP